MSFPADVATTTISGAYILADGTPAIGRVVFTPSAVVKNLADNVVISDVPIVVELNGLGAFAVELPVSQDDLIPSSFLYQVDEYFDGNLSRSWSIRLDESMGPAVSIVSLSPAAPPTNSVIYPTLGDVASVAADLDQSVYAAVNVVSTGLAQTNALLGNFVHNSDIGTTVPPIINGKVPAQYLPNISLGHVFTVNSQAAMLALLANVGDVAVRTDNSNTYILANPGASTLGNWTQLNSSAAVNSVNGYTGTVVLTYLDVGAASSSHTHSSLNVTSISGASASFSTLSGSVSINAGPFVGVRSTITPGNVSVYDSSLLFANIDAATHKVELTGGATINQGLPTEAKTARIQPTYVTATSPANTTDPNVRVGTTFRALTPPNSTTAAVKVQEDFTLEPSTGHIIDTGWKVTSGPTSVTDTLNGNYSNNSTINVDDAFVQLFTTRTDPGGTYSGNLNLAVDGTTKLAVLSANTDQAVLPATTTTSLVNTAGQPTWQIATGTPTAIVIGKWTNYGTLFPAFTVNAPASGRLRVDIHSILGNFTTTGSVLYFSYGMNFAGSPGYDGTTGLQTLFMDNHTNVFTASGAGRTSVFQSTWALRSQAAVHELGSSQVFSFTPGLAVTFQPMYFTTSGDWTTNNIGFAQLTVTPLP